jgi:membrane protein
VIQERPIIPADRILDQPPPAQLQQRVWDLVSRSPLRSLWNLEGIPLRVIAKHTWTSLLDDNLVGRAAELGFFFIFSLFPGLFTATSLLGLAARSASHIYYMLLGYLAIVIPHAAMGTVLETFNETTAAATSGKLTFGLVAAIWSASVGFSAILITLILTSLLGGDFFARVAYYRIHYHLFAAAVGFAARLLGWIFATILLALFFAVIYYFAPDVKTSRWHWLTPGAAIGIVGWLLASIGLRIYVHLFDNYSVTYGSLGAVIILLTWFYLTGLMLLLGAEINSEIEAAAAAKHMLAGTQADVSTTPPIPPTTPA